jgi:hypothetical protein
VQQHAIHVFGAHRRSPIFHEALDLCLVRAH